MRPKRERDTDTRPAPGKRFTIDACRCTECERLVTAEASIARGCGPRCYEKRGPAREHAQLELQGQIPMPWEAGA